MKICAALCIVVAGTATAAAQRAPLDEAIVGALVKDGMSEAQVRASYDACDSGGAISMKICFRYRLKGEQIRIENAYRELRGAMLKKSASANAQSLERSQAAWTKYQQLHCSLEGDLSNFDYGAVMLACQWTLAKQRADSLVETLSWYSPKD
jgi:uncharacterized protein YecT (DUF1311 family)